MVALVVRRMAGRRSSRRARSVVLVQVENELQPTDKDYVAWCGAMAARACRRRRIGARHDVQRRDRGSTINTCNGNDCSDFLETHEQSGRSSSIGRRNGPRTRATSRCGVDSAARPGALLWGRDRRPGAQRDEVVARGGSHADYYMWAGGSNFGRWTGDAITTMYAADAIVC